MPAAIKQEVSDDRALPNEYTPAVLGKKSRFIFSARLLRLTLALTKGVFSQISMNCKDLLNDIDP